MPWFRRLAWCGFLWGAVASAARAQVTVINGRDFPILSTGNIANTTSWTLDRNGYLGTYIHVDSPGDVTIGVQAEGQAYGGISPHMNVVLADTVAGFDVAAAPANYQRTFSLPAGTYFLRTEFNNDLGVTPRQLTVDNLTVSGATVYDVAAASSATKNFYAIDSANTYINNFRRGDVSIGLSGLAPGTQVGVSLKRIGFNFGTEIGGTTTNSVNTYLGSPTNGFRTTFQQKLNQDFNAIVPGNAGKWGSNEATRNSPNMGGVDAMLNYAQAHNMYARMHNLIWGKSPDGTSLGQQPNWVLNSNKTGLLDMAVAGNAAAAADLRNAISSRIKYYVGDGPGGNADRAVKYNELDVYNESYHTGEISPAGYWNTYGVGGDPSVNFGGIAGIYNEVKQAVAAAGASTKLYVNEYGVLGDAGYANYYVQHLESLREAGIEAGYGDVVDGIGSQYYPNSAGAHVPAAMEAVLQNLAVEGKPVTLTEFGVAAGVSALDSANILEDSMRLMFGNPQANGFYMWGFDAENGGGNLFAPAAALYTVSGSLNGNPTWTITPAGQRYEWLFGYGPDPQRRGNNANPWNTQLTATVGPDGRINFNGFYGDYQLTINGHLYNLSLVKGTSNYYMVVAAGDYNGDAIVDAADYTIWRDTIGSTSDLRADGNGDGMIDAGDYSVWQSNFGATYPAAGAGASAAVPEPATAVLGLLGLISIAAGRTFKRRIKRGVKLWLDRIATSTTA
jgi:GH35 family endo-1,4-beta-xylanase